MMHQFRFHVKVYLTFYELYLWTLFYSTLLDNMYVYTADLECYQTKTESKPYYVLLRIYMYIFHQIMLWYLDLYFFNI